jgi:hypothetical protein
MIEPVLFSAESVSTTTRSCKGRRFMTLFLEKRRLGCGPIPQRMAAPDDMTVN